MSVLAKSFRWLLVLAAICAVVWLATVIWWQETHRAVDEADVVLFIVLLPLVLFWLTLGLWFGVRAIRRRREAAALAATASTSATPAVVPSQEDPLRYARLNVHAIAMTTLAGSDAESLLGKLAENQSLAKPSKDQFDLDGFRIALARIDTLDLAETERWYESHLRQLDPARHPVDHEAERIQRCLAMLEPALDEALMAIEDLLQLPPPVLAPKPVRPSAKAATPAALPPPTLRAVALIPDELSEAARALIKTWLEPRLVQAVAASRAPVLLTLLPVKDDAPPAMLIERFNLEVNGSVAPDSGRDVLLLIGMDSSVDEASLRRLESAGTLRTATRPQGEVPGEAVFVLALTAASIHAADRLPLASLHRVAVAQRARPPEHRGKVSSAALRDAVRDAFALSEIAADTCGTMICDGDGYGPRGFEAAEALTFSLEHLDAVADRLSPGAVLGQLGAASLPALLCIAAAQVAAKGNASLVTLLAPPLDRHVLLAVPPTPPSEPPQA